MCTTRSIKKELCSIGDRIIDIPPLPMDGLSSSPVTGDHTPKPATGHINMLLLCPSYQILSPFDDSLITIFVAVSKARAAEQLYGPLSPEEMQKNAHQTKKSRRPLQLSEQTLKMTIIGC